MFQDKDNNKEKRPRILMIAPLPPPVHGSAMMTQYIKDSYLINKAFDLDWVNLSTSRRMDEIGKKSFSKLFRFTNAYFKTFWKLITGHFDACYIAITCHGKGFIKDAPFALLCKLFGRKLVIHQHNKGMRKDLNSSWRVRLLKMVYKNAYVILLSWRLYPDIEAIVERDQIYICPNGIPIEQSIDIIPSRNNSIPHLLFLSNLMPSKGVYVLLDALKILKDNGYQFICNFVGGESKEISAKTFSDEVSYRRLNGQVYYLGKKYDAEKNEILIKHDIFIFPTYYDNECFPLVLLEAMQAGLPCISTEEGGIADIINDGVNGKIIPTIDSEDLALKIKELIDFPETRKNLGENGRATFYRKYTLDKWENNLKKIFKVCIEH